MYSFAYGIKIRFRPPHYFPIYSVFQSITLSSPWYWTTLDAVSAYWSMPLVEEDHEKTTFSVPQ